MLRSQRFRDEHDEILEIVSKISKELSEEHLANDALEVRKLLSTLMGKLREHLALEDELLYPSLKKHGDESVREMAEQFSSEMGHIAGTATAYSNDWLTTKKIQENPSEFISATKGVFHVLGLRIQKENKQLYAALDEIEGG